MVLRCPVDLTVAGRTDAGVHATGQVAHCDVPREPWAEQGTRLVRRLRGVLPPDIAVPARGGGAVRSSTPGSRRWPGTTSTG